MLYFILNLSLNLFKLVKMFLYCKIFLLLFLGDILFTQWRGCSHIRRCCERHTHIKMSHIVLWWLRVDRVLCCEGNAAHSDDRQDAELKILQSQNVVTAPPKPGANPQMHTHCHAPTHAHTQTHTKEYKTLWTFCCWVGKLSVSCVFLFDPDFACVSGDLLTGWW